MTTMETYNNNLTLLDVSTETTSITTTTMTMATTTSSVDIKNCESPQQVMYESIFGIALAMPQWEAIGTAVILSLIIVLTIVGNILVILSVFTYKPLRIVQNFFIVSLAVADLTVAILVLPLNVAYSIRGRWDFGIHVCKMWLTSDVLCCTASILNLCAIALDRYWAITDPINYAQKRTVERVLILIIGVWVLSLVISSPPLIGWNDWPDHFSKDTPCQLTANQGYVIYSSLGSFFIPLIIMTIVYIEIYVATRRRLRERARASKINAMALKSSNMTTRANNDPLTNNNNSGSGERGERESISSELNHNDPADATHANNNTKDMKRKKKKKDKKKMAKDSIKDLKDKQLAQIPIMANEDSVTDVHDNDNNQVDCETKTTVIEIEKSNVKIKENVGNINNNNISNNNNTAAVNAAASAAKTNTTVCQNRTKPVPKAVVQFIEEKQRISLSKERRAARTLGIIMGKLI